MEQQVPTASVTSPVTAPLTRRALRAARAAGATPTTVATVPSPVPAPVSSPVPAVVSARRHDSVHTPTHDPVPSPAHDAVPSPALPVLVPVAPRVLTRRELRALAAAQHGAATAATDDAPHADAATSERVLRTVRTHAGGDGDTLVLRPVEVHTHAADAVRGGTVRSRRELRAATAPVAPVRRRRAGRAGVLSALVAATVVVPVVHGLGDDEAPAAGTAAAAATTQLPSTVTALTAPADAPAVPPALASAPASRSLEAASRSEARSPLPGCSGVVASSSPSNGLVPQSDLCTLWDGTTEIRADAAVALAGLNEAYAARFGEDLCLVSGYRTLAQQRAVKAAKGGLAATPGKSNHGWGLAVDICSAATTGAKWEWLNENAGVFGWENPDWAQPGGSGPYERWHWEYLTGVKADGEYYGS
ncbi:hypothetical protein Cma02nite_08590 [Cellulomonas marina]|uniref:D-alanyl-D-alanine carboxypeptidase n=1 Tax=Cellulomonas marina TaxID=988821 RepID=A0A1I0V241_9CELL|nr:hypothetical protein Cma02nite_08590 [Cellulomonas marina]SFA70097.1 D-alanyl-D-alanine carboxypeptidase [Cellulomonas marina]